LFDFIAEILYFIIPTCQIHDDQMCVFRFEWKSSAEVVFSLISIIIIIVQILVVGKIQTNDNNNRLVSLLSKQTPWMIHTLWKFPTKNETCLIHWEIRIFIDKKWVLLFMCRFQSR
jgi:hypothetical protein